LPPVDNLRSLPHNDGGNARLNLRADLQSAFISKELRMPDSSTVEVVIEQAIARLTAEVQTLHDQMQVAGEKALEDWLIVEACKDYDTIDLDSDLTGKSRRKQYKALRDKKRNTEKMIVALQDLLTTLQAEAGDKLVKKFEAEREKYQA
jgi:hypothetical protein